MEKIIIGLTGAQGAGKDTVADILVTQHGFTKHAFADAVKQELAQAFSCDINIFYDRYLKEADHNSLAINRCSNRDFIKLSHDLGVNLDEAQSPRYLMQIWGTEFRRGQNPYYWCEKLTQKTQEQQTNRVVISDVRFENEASFVKLASFNICEIWKIERKGLSVSSLHESDKNNIKSDLTIYNNHSIEILAETIRESIKNIEGKND